MSVNLSEDFSHFYTWLWAKNEHGCSEYIQGKLVSESRRLPCSMCSECPLKVAHSYAIQLEFLPDK